MQTRAQFLSVLPLLLVAACASDPVGPEQNPPLRPSFDAENEDHTKPVLTALDFSPTEINTTAGSAVVTVSYTVTDDLSGVKELCGQFTSPSGHFSLACTSFPPSTNQSGTFDFGFNQFIEPGTWKLQIFSVNDVVGNGSDYSTAQLAAAGFPTDLEVTSVQDNTKPVLTALGILPSAINTTSGSAVVTVSYTVTDDLSGVKELCGQFTSPSGAQFRLACTSFPPTTSQSGTFDFGFPQFIEPGTWKLQLFSVNDVVGNGSDYSTAQLAAAGFPTELEVTSVLDNTKPVLTALNFSPTAISTAAGPAVVTVSYAVTDDISGVKELCGQFTSPSGAQFRLACASFPPATSQSGTFDFGFPQFGESGIWKLQIFSVNDVVGNGSDYSTAQLAAAGFPTDLLVNASEPVTVFLHGSGSTANPPTLFLDDVAPGGATPKYKDSPSINFAAGNPWKEVGTWTAGSTLLNGAVALLGDVRLWLGLKNSDDVGTRFDVRVEARKNGVPFASGETLCVQNVVRNAASAKEVSVEFAPFPAQSFDGTSDVVSLRILTRVGTNGSGSLCGGHSNAVGLRVYFDAAARQAGFEAIF
jgi:hypothetical protein